MKELQFQLIDISSDDIPIGDNYWEKEFIIYFLRKLLRIKMSFAMFKGLNRSSILGSLIIGGIL